ncbi:hypothetical protein KFJ24_09115 [Marinobacter sediminum]|uniref:hypothetical protein n=1 Tax=Marinobacter sediminum TaxID=256323 RepID=UPI00202F8116|nr:hypothetical protein [Marinobacter sediminum]MCM0612624.1 hypothetical protein [Marinobacter sediminum]
MPELIASFFLVFVGGVAVLYSSLRNFRVSLPGISLFIFVMLFYILAPVVQLADSMDYLVNTSRFSLSYAIYVNIILFVFLVFYSLSYIWLTSGKVFIPYNHLVSQSARIDVRVSFSKNVVIFISLLASSVFAFNGIQSSIVSLFIFKFLALIAFFGASVYFLSVRGSMTKKQMLFSLFLGLLFFVLFFKNPIFERRNALGPVYLTIACLVAPFLLKGRIFLSFGVLVMVIAFPAASLLTHQYGVSGGGSISTEQLVQQIGGHYNDLHYDAWSNGVTMQEMIAERGHTMGQQLVGTLLFFVPRAFWPEKPVSSGEMIGQYLMENASLWFSNVSFSFPFEFYLDFGIGGVFIAAFALAYFVFFLEKRADYSVVWNILMIYFSFYIYFLMRGPFLPAFAYFVPVILACWISGKVFTYKVEKCA